MEAEANVMVFVKIKSPIKFIILWHGNYDKGTCFPEIYYKAGNRLKTYFNMIFDI